MMRRVLSAIVSVFLAGFLASTSVGQDLAEADTTVGAGSGAQADPHGIYVLGTRTVEAGNQYEMGKLGQIFLGDDYRKVWGKTIEVPVIDLSRTAGGLTPTGAAGGVQTSLLFMEGADGRHFILRKLEKKAGDALPEGTRRTIVEDIAQDQISSLNPYSAFVIADMARAAGVLHTAPALVFIPDDPQLGEYREEFASHLALIERKVDEDVSDAERFAHSNEVIDFEDLLERIQADPETRVDQRAYVRTRLFDMFLGDRDRHDGQWFWAATDDGRRFLPLPIDRDFAFARFDGLLSRVGRFSGRIALRKMTYFAEDIDNLVGLNHQAAKLDYLFTSELDRGEWNAVAEELRAALTDDVLEQAIAKWPRSVFDEIGEETIAVLKSRRDRLPSAAEDYYELLMQKVDVVGSNEAERFVISRVDDEHTDVVVEHDGRELFRRRIVADDTDELRLFGLGGDDEFVLTGPSRAGVLVLVVGGEGDDVVRTDDGAPAERLRFYDTDVNAATEEVVADVDRLDDPRQNDYQLHRYEFDRVGHAFSFDYDSDEGVYIGGGVKMTRFGFMREPYAAKHRIVANYAPRSRGYNIDYDGRINEIVGEWDASIEAKVLDFDRFDDFYGLGNETSGSDANREQFIAQFRWVRAYPAFLRTIGPMMAVAIGPYFEYADIEPPRGVSEDNPTSGFTAEQFTDKYFGGLRSRIEVDGRDTTALPRSGVRFITDAGVHVGLRHSDDRFARIASELSYYVTPLGRFTIALRAGGATNIGDFPFYQANTVGGRKNLRGFRKTRFAGRTSAYGNGELRMKLTDFNVYLTRGELGVFGFFDFGRVWADGEDSNRWHQGYGGGAWVTPFYQFVVRGSVGFSDEGSVFNLSTGLFF